MSTRLLVTLMTIFSQATVAAPKAPLQVFAYEIGSESIDQWDAQTETNKQTSTEILGLFTEKHDSKTKLMMFRRPSPGDKACEQEKISYNAAKKVKREVTYEALPSPPGWSCVFRAKNFGTETLTGVRTFVVKGKSRSLPYAIVFSAESMSEKRFMAILSSTTETKK